MKEYNAIISLGTSCQTAYQLERKGLRRCSGPLDWLISPLESTTRLLSNWFNDFMKKENLEIIGIYENRNFIVKDRVSNVVSYHNFSISEDGKIKSQEYDTLITKLRNSIDRLYVQLETFPSLLFIINGEKSNPSDYVQLLQALLILRKDLHFHVIACGYAVPVTVDRQLENISFYKFQKIARRKTTGDAWKGNDDEWDKCLADVLLCQDGIGSSGTLSYVSKSRRQI